MSGMEVDVGCRCRVWVLAELDHGFGLNVLAADEGVRGPGRFTGGVHGLAAVQNAHEPPRAPASLTSGESRRAKHMPARMPAFPGGTVRRKSGLRLRADGSNR